MYDISPVDHSSAKRSALIDVTIGTTLRIVITYQSMIKKPKAKSIGQEVLR